LSHFWCTLGLRSISLLSMLWAHSVSRERLTHLLATDLRKRNIWRPRARSLVPNRGPHGSVALTSGKPQSKITATLSCQAYMFHTYWQPLSLDQTLLSPSHLKVDKPFSSAICLIMYSFFDSWTRVFIASSSGPLPSQAWSNTPLTP